MTYNVTFPHLGLEFNINPVAFSIGNFHVYWYGIIIAAGFLLALIYASFSCKKMNIDINRLFDVVIVGLIAGVIFARLFYVVFYPGDKYWKTPLEIFQIHDGGLAIYGGIIGAVVFGSLMAKLRKLKVTAVLDIAALGFLIGQCVGRWGNFINQEAFGSATELPWGMHSENTAAVVDGNVHPCFLYESLLCLLGFVLLHFFTRRFRRYDGQTFLLYIVWYGACRFFIEGLRTDSLYIPGTNIRTSQLVAACSAVVALILLLVNIKRRHKPTYVSMQAAQAESEGGEAEKDSGESADAETSAACTENTAESAPAGDSQAENESGSSTEGPQDS